MMEQVSWWSRTDDGAGSVVEQDPCRAGSVVEQDPANSIEVVERETEALNHGADGCAARG